jgi:FixJ family two-component response regulator
MRHSQNLKQAIMDTATNCSPASRSGPQASGGPLVFVVDDDIALRDSLGVLIARSGLRVALFGCATEFLASPRPPSPSCLVLDMNLPDLNGLELQERIATERAVMPIIFITGRGDISMSVQAMKAGAVEFLTKPFTPAVLLHAIQGALERSQMCLDEQATLQPLRARYQALSHREREVMALVVRGLLNKQVSGQLGISEITVKQHRGRMMRKMRMRSLPELVTIAARLGLVTAGKG